jgi:ParB family chromosome partitioning protein
VAQLLIKVGDRFRKDMGDLDSLAASIKDIGLLQPIGIDSNYRLIFGERRLRAFAHLGLERIPARFVDVAKLVAEHAENEVRKDFTPSERVAIGKAIEDELGNRRGQRTDLKAEGQGELIEELPQNFGEVKRGETSKVAAKKAGFGNPETYRQAKTVVSQAEPELIEAMDRGEVAISTAAKLVMAPPETQQYAAANPKEAPAIAANHRAIGTGENEWYTPAVHLQAARAVLGGIDLDPASSPLANETVGADQIFTLADDGLNQPWAGKVWLNPPYSQPAIANFAEKLASEWQDGNLESAIALTHNYTDTAWFHRLATACSAICFTRGRIGFVNPEGKKAAPTQGQAFFYFGEDVDTFADQFGAIGFVVEVR